MDTVVGNCRSLLDDTVTNKNEEHVPSQRDWAETAGEICFSCIRKDNA